MVYMVEMKNGYTTLIKIPTQREKPLWGPKRRWKDDIKVGFKSTELWTTFLRLRIESDGKTIREGVL